MNGDNDLVKRLLEEKASVNEKDSRGVTALHLAALHGHNEVVQALLKNNAVVNEKENRGWTALHFAAQNGRNEVLQTLLTNNASIDEKQNDGFTALHFAAGNGHNEVVQTLLKNNATINEKVNKGWTALQFAAANGHNDVVQTLLMNNAAIDEKLRDGRAALHLAAAKGHNDVVQTLLKNSAAINEKHTAVHIAAQNGHNEVVETLLNSYAAVDEKTYNGETARQVAQRNPGATTTPHLQHITPQLPPWPRPVAATTTTTSQPQQQHRTNTGVDFQSVVAQQRSVARAPTIANAVTSTLSRPNAHAVLEIDWQLVLSQSGLQNQLASMQAAIAANDRAQLELRAADAQLDSRVAANAARIAEHHERLAELEFHRHVQSGQLDILRALQHKPAQLLFYRTLLINIEAVFLSCKAVMGGFVDLGGDAASSKTLTGAAKATKVCGTVLSLLPGGALIKGAANLTAAGVGASERVAPSEHRDAAGQEPDAGRGVAGRERCGASTDGGVCGAARVVGANRADRRR